MFEAFIISILSSSLVSFVKGALSYASRLSAERKAGRNPVDIDLLESNLEETLSRIIGGDFKDSWWRRVSQINGHTHITPEFLRKPAIQEWLKNEDVASDLKFLAKRALVKGTTDAEVRKRLTLRYSELTGELDQFSNNPIDTILAVLVSGYIASISPNQRSAIGLIQTISAQINERFDDAEHFGFRLIFNDAIKNFHNHQAESELSQLVDSRIFNPDNSRKKAANLYARLTNGDLIAADDHIKEKVIYWCARLFAVDSDSLTRAKEYRNELQRLNFEASMTIVDALIARTEGDINTALRLLRDVDCPDHRSVFFNILVNSEGGSSAALEWYSQTDKFDDPKFFTEFGWRDWSISMCRLGKWREVTQKLVDLESTMYETPLLALIGGVINATMLLPTEMRETDFESVPLYRGISPQHGEEAQIHHTRASTFFDFVEQNIQANADQVIKRHIADWQRWIRLMSPKVAYADSVQEEIRRELESDPPSVELIPFAFAFQISFNLKPMRQYLNKRKLYGGLTKDELYAECIVYEKCLAPREYVKYLEGYHARLKEVVPLPLLINLRANALIQDNQKERALTLVNNQAEFLGQSVVERFKVRIEALEGADLRSQLEQNFQQTDSIFDLKNLIQHLNKIGDSKAVKPLILEQFNRHPNINNAIEVVHSLGRSPFFDYTAILEFSDENHAIFSESDELKSIKAHALFCAGEFRDAKAINDELLSSRKNEYDLFLNVNIAINSGNWETIIEIVEMVWGNKDDYDPKFLMQLAHLTSQISTDEIRALQLSKVAVEKAPNSPELLTSAIELHFKLGLDEEIDPNWYQQAYDYSTIDKGPVWQYSLEDIVTQVFPKRRERLNDMEQKWLSGQLPISFMAHVFNLPLVRLLRYISKQNETKVDGRHRIILPIIYAERKQVRIQDDWVMVLDITSIIILSHLGLLEKAVSAFDHVMLPHDVFKFLFREGASVRFHQPYLIMQAKQVVNLMNRGEIAKSEILGVPQKAIVDEVGDELATLLQMAQRNNGKVVCALPILKPGSFTEQHANTSEFDDLIISTLDLCTALKESGALNQADYRRARLYLESRGEANRTDLTESISNFPIYVDRDALFYLQDAKILQPIAATEQLDLRLHPNVVSEMNALVEEEDVGSELTNNIKEIRLILTNAVESGKASFLSHTFDYLEQSEGYRIWSSGFKSLLKGYDECDAICIDDRCINRYPAATEPGGRLVPIICVLDVISHLNRKESISTSEQWNLRHKLRKGGFCFVPLESDELMHWLLTAKLTDSGLTECEELRTIRQTMSYVCSLQVASESEVRALVDNILVTGVQTITRLWERTSVAAANTRVLSNWVWNFMIINAFLGREHYKLSINSTIIQDRMSRQIAGLLLPKAIQSQERRSQYTKWIEESVLMPLRIGNTDIIRSASRSIIGAIANDKHNSELFGYIFLDQSPNFMRELILNEDKEFAKKYGLTFQRRFSIGGHFRILEDEFFATAKEVLKSNVKQKIGDLNGKEIQIESDHERKKVTLKWSDESGKVHQVVVPQLALLSPKPAVRVKALKNVIDVLGAAATNYRFLHDTIEFSEVDENILSEIILESTGGVAARQSDLIRKLVENASFGSADLVPQSISYYEKFCGPIPLNPEDPEDYIRSTLAVYRKKLLHLDLRTGLEICCLGAVRDDLSPGQWVADIDDDALWETLVPSIERIDPFSSLGMLDIVLYRQHDHRFQNLSKQIIDRLLDENSTIPESPTVYEFLELIAEYVFHQINLVEDMPKHPSFWKRMCAWMQAGLIARAMVAGSKIDFETLREWVMKQWIRAGIYSESLAARVEPMSLVDQLMPNALRYQVLVRLHTLKARHEINGRKVWRSDDISNALVTLNVGDEFLPIKPFGLLEFHKQPTKIVPPEFFEYVENSATDDVNQSTILPILSASQYFTLREIDLNRAKSALESLATSYSNSSSLSTLKSLEYLGIIAAINRDRVLADRIGEVIVGLYATNVQPNQMPSLIGFLLQTAAAYEEYDHWFNWLDKNLTLFGTRLKREKGETLREFIEILDEIASVLPVDSWFQIRARIRASAGEG